MPWPASEDRPMLKAWPAFRDIGNVANDSRGRGIAASARSGHQELAKKIGLDRHRICNAMDLRDNGSDRHHGGMNTLLNAAVGLLRNAQQLDAIAEFGRCLMSAWEIFRYPRDRYRRRNLAPNARLVRIESLCAVSLPSISKVGSASA